MNRRFFLAAAALSALAPGLARAAGMVDFTPGAIDAALASGKAVLVDYAADWCSTCKAQARRLAALRAANPDYDANIVFIRVDWDDYRTHEVTTSRRIPRRSTLVLLKGEAELGRVVAETSEAAIKALLDRAL